MFIACTNSTCSEKDVPKRVPTDQNGQPPPDFSVEAVHCGVCRHTEMQEVPEP